MFKCYQCQKDYNSKEEITVIDKKIFCDDCFVKIISGQEQVRDIDPLPESIDTP